MKTLYVLVVNNTWAKLYETPFSPVVLTLVYQQACIVSGHAAQHADEELARRLHRLLKVEHRAGKFDLLKVLASEAMHSVLHHQFSGDWPDLLQGKIENLPPRFTDADLEVYIHNRLAQLHTAQGAGFTLTHKPGATG